MTDIPAYHLPGLSENDVSGWSVREYAGGEVRLRVPVLTAEGLQRILDRMIRARTDRLIGMPVDRVVAAIDATAARLADPEDAGRRILDDALPAVTGYSPPMVRLVLDRMLADWRTPALRELLHAELGDPRILDGFHGSGTMPGSIAPAAGRSVRLHAVGPGLAFQIFAGNVPGVAVTALIRTLLVKAATLGKTASGDPLFPAIFASALATVEPRLGDCLAVTYWPGGSEDLERTALEAAETVVVYGGEDVVRHVRSRIGTGTRLIEHGPRLSFGLVARERLSGDAAASEVATDAARAIATFDQQGCVSPHVVYAEQGGAVDPQAFAALLSNALAALEPDLPRGALSPAEAAAIQRFRAAAEFRELGGQPVRLHASTGTQHTVIFDPDPAFSGSCLNRLVWVKPLPDLAMALDQVRPYAHLLQTVGIAATPDRTAELGESLARIGASRITTFGRMPWPAPTWHHDGRSPLRELLRWCDLEEDDPPGAPGTHPG